MTIPESIPRDLAVILVTWNTRDLALNALRTLYDDLASTGLEAGVWVVDNASADGTADAIREQFPQTQVIDAGANLGFARGNNLALRALGFSDRPQPNPAGPRAVFLLNPDTLTTHGAISTLYQALFSLPQAGIVGAQLAYEDGTFQHSAFCFPSLTQIVIDLFPLPPRLFGRLYGSRLNGRYPPALYQAGQPFPVDHPLGATMLFRREAIEATGLFDEQFFMYSEEVDWSLRVRQAGWINYVIPAAQIFHLEGRSTAQVKPRSVVNLWTSRIKYYRKHYSPPRRAAAMLLVRLGMRLQSRRVRRDATLTASQRDELIAAYRQVLQATAE